MHPVRPHHHRRCRCRRRNRGPRHRVGSPACGPPGGAHRPGPRHRRHLCRGRHAGAGQRAAPPGRRPAGTDAGLRGTLARPSPHPCPRARPQAAFRPRRRWWWAPTPPIARRWPTCARPSIGTGLEVSRLSLREARAHEPLLSPNLAAAYLVPRDHQVDPRAVARAILDGLRGRRRGRPRRRRAAAW